MTLEDYFYYKRTIRNLGFENDYKYIEQCLENPCNDSKTFAHEYIWVVLNSGMRYQIASKIYAKVIEGLDQDIPIEYIFSHEGKVEGINYVFKNRETIFSGFKSSSDQINFLENLPWIGPVTKYHLARNLGINVCKPDRHLVRIAKKFDNDPSHLCKKLSKESGDLIGIVDFVLWSCGNQGIL